MEGEIIRRFWCSSPRWPVHAVNTRGGHLGADQFFLPACRGGYFGRVCRQLRLGAQVAAEAGWCSGCERTEQWRGILRLVHSPKYEPPVASAATPAFAPAILLI